MFKSLRWRLIIIVLAMTISGWQLYSKGLKLGLDLQGGMYLVLEVDDPDGTMTDEAKADMIDRIERVIRIRIDEFGVEEPLVQTMGRDRLIVELAGLTDEEQAKDIVTRIAFLEFKLVLPTTDVIGSLASIDRTIVQTLGIDSIRAMGRDVTTQGDDLDDALDILSGILSGATDTTSSGSDSVQTAVDSVQAAADSAQAAEDAVNPFSSLLFGSDVEGTFLVAIDDVPVAEYFLSLPEVQRRLPRDQALQWGANSDLVERGMVLYRRLWVLTEDPFLTGELLQNATAGRDPQQFNQSMVDFELTRAGGAQFSRFTAANVGRFLAIVLDGEVMSAPVIQSRIGQRGQITMGQGTSLQEAADLALVLRAGALPVSINIIEERTVGPSLGQDSIDQGRVAGMIGIFLVVVIMIGYYRMAGVLAVSALGVYLLFVLGGLAGIGASLTVPGIAGLILSVGMAVDANVLIFERIREELVAGRAPRTAVDEGFAHALSAIVDANITTLITALILYQFGSGPVQGFAITLSIGIIASFVSALYVTRSFFLLYLSGRKASDPISV